MERINPMSAALQLNQYVQSHRRGQPLPLQETNIQVYIQAGLTTVTTERVFENKEVISIEATLTFPVPVNAVVSHVHADIDGRRLNAKAQKRQSARETYEQAIDSGRTSVLHEEILRGVHMLSVGHVPPGKQVRVTSVWSMPLTALNISTAQFRIPTTVGDIYGCSPLSPSDDLVTSQEVYHKASLTIDCPDGTINVSGSTLVNGTTSVTLDRPIVLTVSGNAIQGEVIGHAADGKQVRMTVKPMAQGSMPLNATILLDHSGSMNSYLSDKKGEQTKHNAIVNALKSLTLNSSDSISGWEFDNSVQKIFECVPGTALAEACHQFHAPRGGTEIGKALDHVMTHTEGLDILLITDGQSHDIDVQALARRGRRVSVVLIGTGALDAYVGHLSGLTGGQIFFTDGTESLTVLHRAFDSLRIQHHASAAFMERPQTLSFIQGGMEISIEWSEPSATATTLHTTLIPVAALATGLTLSCLPESLASDMAEAEGIVSHLTSLVLVDKDGDTQSGIPVQRKIPLMTASGSVMMPTCSMRSTPMSLVASGVCQDWTYPTMSMKSPEIHEWFSMPSTPLQHSASPLGTYGQNSVSLASFGPVDWAHHAEDLRKGDIQSLGAQGAILRSLATTLPGVAALAQHLNQDSLVVIIALLAYRDKDHDRYANRFMRAILGTAPQDILIQALKEVGLNN
jgi:Vault protein inter-alpha-trypsin domain